MEKKEYEWKKELIEMELNGRREIEEYKRQTEKLKHGWELERMRIKSAEIRRTQERKYGR